MAPAPLGGFLRRFMAPAEDPRLGFPDAVELRVELLGDLRRALGRLRQARERLAERAAELRRQQVDLDGATARALAAELEAVTAQLDELDAATQRFSLDEQRLAARIDTYVAHEQLVGARYDAADVRVRIAEALAGLDDEFGRAALAETEGKAAELEARAEAIDSLLADGTFTARPMAHRTYGIGK